MKTQSEQLLDDIRPYLLDPREDYPEPYYMLEFNGVPFSTLGGLQAISGQKKNGKSFVLTQLMAVLLGSNVEGSRIGQYLPGLKVPERTIEYLGHLPRVLYVDTEMEKLNSAKVLRRVHWLCGWDMKKPEERFNTLWLRAIEKEEGLPAYKKRWKIIRKAIDVFEPDVVFIDGIRDIVSDFNNIDESSEMIQEQMALAEKKGICIWNALHMNPRPGNDDESKMRGHLGTELGNKVTDTLASIKHKSPQGVTFTVKQLDARNKDMDDWQFEIVDDAGALGVPKIINSGANLPSKSKEQAQTDSVDMIREWIEQAKTMYEWPMTRSDIMKKVFGEIGGVTNRNKQQANIQVALNTRCLEESTIKAGNGSYMLQPPDELPF